MQLKTREALILYRYGFYLANIPDIIQDNKNYKLYRLLIWYNTAVHANVACGLVNQYKYYMEDLSSQKHQVSSMLDDSNSMSFDL